MSPDFIAATTTSGRFGGWHDAMEVDLISLDDAVSQFGVPSFIKVDVEGYEAEVIKSLSTPVQALSFEITPEHLTPAMASIDHLSQLGRYHYRLSLGESMEFTTKNWIDAAAMKDALASMPIDTFGDVYATLASPSTSSAVSG